MAEALMVSTNSGLATTHVIRIIYQTVIMFWSKYKILSSCVRHTCLYHISFNTKHLSLCKILSAVTCSDLWWRRREPLFKKGCKAIPHIKFWSWIHGSGYSRTFFWIYWRGLCLNSLCKTVNMVHNEGDGAEQFTTAVEVDGIGRSLGEFMKQQEKNNNQLQQNLEHLEFLFLSFMVHVPICRRQGQQSKDPPFPCS